MASPAIEVYVKLPSGRTSSFELLPSDKVSRIYDRIASEEDVPVDRVIIKYTGKILNKSLTLGYLGVCRETILKAEVSQSFCIFQKVKVKVMQLLRPQHYITVLCVVPQYLAKARF